MSNPVIKAKIKKTGEAIEVYKLRDGKFNLFLGDKLSITKLDSGEHLQTFDKEQLEIVNGK